MATRGVYEMVDTWNNGSTVFNAIKMDVTNSASAAGSKLVDLQIGSVSRFSVDPNGNLVLGTQQSVQGSIVLGNTAAGSYATTIKSSNSATAAWTLTLPTDAGSNGQVLQTNGSGVSSWYTLPTTLAVGSLTGLGTGVGTALAVNIGTDGAFVVRGGALGTPSSGTLTNASGLPISGISGLGTGVGTALAVNTGSTGSFLVYGSNGTLGSVNITGTTIDSTDSSGIIIPPITTFNSDVIVENDLRVTNKITAHDLILDGNLTVNGTQTILNTTNYEVEDSLIYIATGNIDNSLDIGVVGHFDDGTYQHTGLVRDATDGTWKLFSNVSSEPDSGTLNFTGAVYDPLKIGSLITSTVNTLTVGLGSGSVSTNTAIGVSALNSITTSGYHVAVGYESLKTFTGGDYGITAIGYQALTASTNGAENTAVGCRALGSSTTAMGNTAIGFDALRSTVSGGYNTAIGDAALFFNTSNGQTAIGYNALYSNTSSSNTAVGMEALSFNSSGQNNVSIGYQASRTGTSGSYNVAVGYQALIVNTANYNTAIGYSAGSALTTGGKNVIIGSYTGNSGGLDIRTSSNNIVLSDGDANIRMVVNSSGNVGIGTTTTTYKLNVNGSTFINQVGLFGYLDSVPTLTTESSILGSDQSFRIKTTGGNVNHFVVQATTGNVGIGASPGSYKFTIKNNGSQFYLNQSNTDNGWVITCEDANGYLKFYRRGEGGSPSDNLRMSIDTSGNVGIGASPASSLSISKQSTALSGTGNAYGLHLYPTSSGQCIIDAITNSVNNAYLTLRTYNNGTYNNLTFDANGNLGVGTDSPNTYKDGYNSTLVVGSGANYAIIQPRTDGPAGMANGVSYGGSYNNNPINGSRIWFGASGPSGQQGQIAFFTKSTNDNTTQPTERMRIGTAGVEFIQFSAAQNSSSDANTLDDYEEGTWTPTIGGSSSNPTYTTNTAVGYYIKIGKLVYVNFLIIVNGVSANGSGNIYVQGFPFSIGTSAYMNHIMIHYNDVWDTAFPSIHMSGNTGLLTPTGVTQGNGNWGATSASSSNLSTGYFSGSGVYYADA